MATQMKQRRGTAAEWTAANEILPDGAIGINSDNHQMKIGNGVTPWNSLPYSTLSPQLVDAVGDLLVGSAPDVVARLPRGLNGQMLTVQADGTLAWTTPSADIPKTIADAVGDLIVGTGADTVGRLARGATGQQLTVQSDGTLAWATPASGGIQPTLVDAAGDLLYGTADNTVARLPRGTTGQVLTATSGSIAWSTPATPTAPIPISLIDAAGDLIVGSADNAAARLAKGANGQVLQVVGGVLTWVTPSADVPLSTVTTQGDLIVASGAGAVTRLAKGATNQRLGIVAGQPGWVDPDPSLPTGIVAQVYRTSSVNSPTTGGETAGLTLISVPIVAGRKYRVRIMATLLRSDNAADQSQLRVRMDTPFTGTTVWAAWFIQWSASFVGQQTIYEFDFVGAASTSTAQTDAPVQIAAGSRNFYFSFNKNSGSGNSAMMTLVGTTTAPTGMTIEDMGT